MTLAYGLGGAFVGIVMGILPGLSATLAIALLTTLTIKLQANDAILVLICSYVGALYGGSRTAILLNIPGTAANARVVRRRLRAGAAAARPAARSASPPRARSVSTLFGVLCLRHLHAGAGRSGAVVRRASSSSGWRSFGVTMSGSIVGNDPLKGWLMGMLGPVRRADRAGRPVRATTASRSAGTRLSGGIALIPALVGRVRPGRGADDAGRSGGAQDRRAARFGAAALSRDRQYWRTVLRSGVIGVFTGLLPGVGRGRRRVDVVRRGEGGEQGEGSVRQGLRSTA